MSRDESKLKVLPAKVSDYTKLKKNYKALLSVLIFAWLILALRFHISSMFYSRTPLIGWTENLVSSFIVTAAVGLVCVAVIKRRSKNDNDFPYKLKYNIKASN